MSSNEQLTFLPCPRWISPACSPRAGIVTPVVEWPDKQGLVHVLASSYTLDLGKDADQSKRRFLRNVFEVLATACRGLASDVRGKLTLYTIDAREDLRDAVTTGEVGELALRELTRDHDRIFAELTPQWRMREIDTVFQVDLAITRNGKREYAWARVPLSWGTPVFHPEET
mgnify:CR=1 FL=1